MDQGAKEYLQMYFQNVLELTLDLIHETGQLD